MRKVTTILVSVLMAASVCRAQQNKLSAALVRHPPPPGTVRLPENIEAANIIHKVELPNPSNCDMCAHVGGTVVLLALISKAGDVEKLTVLSGPDIFKTPTLNAVRQWRYRPYMVKGKPTVVQTTITIRYELSPPAVR